MHKYLLILFAFTIQASKAQSLKNFHSLSGKIIESESKSRVEFANISVQNTGINCVSNEYGEFRINVPVDSHSIVLLVSRLGYEVNKQKVNLPFAEKLIVSLKPSAYLLNEVKVSGNKRKESARKIVKQAIENIPHLFYQDTLIYQGYYREYVKHDSLPYINLYEAVIKSIDRGYDYYYDNQQHELLWQQFNNAFLFDSLLLKKYDLQGVTNNNKYLPGYKIPTLEGNEFNILLAHNAIRRYNERSFSFVNVLKRDFIMNHTFRLDSISTMNDELMYCISFSYKYNEEPVYVKRGFNYEFDSLAKKYDIHGKMIIAKKSKAIFLFEYVNSDAYKITVENRKFKNWYYTSYVGFSNAFFLNIPISSAAKYKTPQKQIPPLILSISQRNANQFYIKFSKPIIVSQAETCSNYNISSNSPEFNRRNSNTIIKPIKTIYLEKDTASLLYLEKNWELIMQSDKKEKESGLNITVENLTDVDGNTINHQLSVKFMQCREFL